MCSEYGHTTSSLSYCANKRTIPNQYNSTVCCNSPVLPAQTTETVAFAVIQHDYQGFLNLNDFFLRLYIVHQYGETV
jgi:hypothetical protein